MSEDVLRVKKGGGLGFGWSNFMGALYIGAGH